MLRELAGYKYFVPPGLSAPAQSEQRLQMAQSSPHEVTQLLEDWSSGDQVALDEALNDLATIATEQSRIVELRYFGGLTIEETAEIMGLTVDKIKRDWAMAKTWLYDELNNTDE